MLTCLFPKNLAQLPKPALRVSQANWGGLLLSGVID
jgi:hypothetical protein